MTFGWAYILIGWLVMQRLAELAYARSNTRALLARGAQEIGAEHYPLFVVLHSSWLITMAMLTAPSPPVPWLLLGAFVLVQAARVWVIATLGPYWTTRVITVPDAPLVARGPFRFVRHPNYLVVAVEIPLVPLILGLEWVALIFGAANLALLAYRIRVEDRALQPRRASA
jgi:methyltransferase